MALIDEGFEVIRGALSPDVVDALQMAVVQVYGMQARKRFPDWQHLVDVDRIAYALEADPEVGYQCLPMLAQHPAAHTFAALPLWRQLLSDAELPLVTAPSLFINLPSSKRLLYRWHAEAHYYPKRLRFLNVWAPLFRPKRAGSGTLVVSSGSHLLSDLPFAEYDGYDAETVGKRHHFAQLEIPERFLPGATVYVEADPGDVVIFDRRTVHASSTNTTDLPSYAVVARVWDPTDDLTLSGDIAVRPYTGADIGRPGL